MRGRFQDQGGLFSYIRPEERIPADHPLREIRKLVREVLIRMRAGHRSRRAPIGETQRTAVRIRSRSFERTSWNRLARHGVLLDIVWRRDRRKTPVSVLEALRSWRYAKAQPTAAVRRAQSRSAVTPVVTTGACIARLLRLLGHLLTRDARPRG